MNWIPQGRIIEWQAQCPVVDDVGDRWRIYYGHRIDGMSRLAYIDVKAGKPGTLLSEPIVNESLGAPGTFDEHGIIPTCIINHGNQKFLYYIGWSRRVSVPYANAIGLMISFDSGKTWIKRKGSIIQQDDVDPFFTGTCWVTENIVVREAYYLSCIGWDDNDNPYYNIKIATSKDGIFWNKEDKTILSLKPGEGGISSVTIHGNNMWYSYRGSIDFRGGKGSYRIGNAELLINGVWMRKDDVIIHRSGWDSNMQCYPYVIKHGDKLFMFYNGNEFGKTGIGYATLQL